MVLVLRPQPTFRVAVPRAQSMRRAISSRPVQASRRSLVVMASSLKDAVAQPANAADISTAPGVYAIYDKNDKLQFIGLSRKIAASVSGHLSDLGADLVASVRTLAVPEGTKEALQLGWKTWVTEYVETSGEVPPGNAPGVTTWTQRKAKPTRPEIRLTPGKGIQDLTVPIETIIDQVVKSVPVVAFIKGTRTEPQCGFSYKMLSILNETKIEYDVVNVLDEVYNPGLREAIKGYSAWPTIPQLYVKGEFIGGSDIVEEMMTKGQLQPLLDKVGKKVA